MKFSLQPTQQHQKRKGARPLPIDPFQKRSKEGDGATASTSRITPPSVQKAAVPTDEEDAISPEEMSQRLKNDGNALAEAGQLRKAVARWDSALRLTPGNAILHELKAQALMELGHTFQAVKAATEATLLDPTWAEGHLTLGRAQLNLGELSLASQSFERSIELEPTLLEAKEELKEVRALLLEKAKLVAQRKAFLEAHKEALMESRGEELLVDCLPVSARERWDQIYCNMLREGCLGFLDPSNSSSSSSSSSPSASASSSATSFQDERTKQTDKKQQT
ncbi:Tetratricopeptide repeat domain 33 [Balamuthia mandrillaris]